MGKRMRTRHETSTVHPEEQENVTSTVTRIEHHDAFKSRPGGHKRRAVLHTEGNGKGHGDISGLTCLSLRVPDAAALSSSHVTVFIKEADEAVTDARTRAALLVLSENGDLIANDAAICALFSGAIRVLRRGTVEGTLAFALLEFSSREGVLRALALPSVYPTTSETGSALGLRGKCDITNPAQLSGEHSTQFTPYSPVRPAYHAAWLANVDAHQRSDHRKLQAAADASVLAFDVDAAAKAAAVETLAQRMEADGFTLVSRGVKPQRGEQAQHGGVELGETAKTKRKSLVATDFYTFQNRESKADAIKSLRARFDDDRRRAAAFASGIKVEPYAVSSGAPPSR